MFAQFLRSRLDKLEMELTVEREQRKKVCVGGGAAAAAVTADAATSPARLCMQKLANSMGTLISEPEFEQQVKQLWRHGSILKACSVTTGRG